MIWITNSKLGLRKRYFWRGIWSGAEWKKITIFLNAQNVHPTPCYRCHKQLIKNQYHSNRWSVHTCHMRWKQPNICIHCNRATYFLFNLKFHYTCTSIYIQTVAPRSTFHHTNIIMQSKSVSVFRLCELLANTSADTKRKHMKWNERKSYKKMLSKPYE